jgi:hypothetical protein
MVDMWDGVKHLYLIVLGSETIKAIEYSYKLIFQCFRVVCELNLGSHKRETLIQLQVSKSISAIKFLV